MDQRLTAIPAELGIADEDYVYVIPDRVHGPIPITRLAQKVLLTKEVQLTKYRSHTGLMTGAARLNAGDMRCPHQIGAYMMALIVTRLPEFRAYRDLLTWVLLGHDIGHPPYPHSCEPAMIRVLGVDHETIIPRYFAKSEWARVGKAEHFKFADGAALIAGSHPNPNLRDLVNAKARPDLESLEGTCRYALTWTYAGDGLPYRPSEIAYCYKLGPEGRLILQEIEGGCNLELELYKAQQCRREIFNMIHSPVIEAPEVLLARALHFACEVGQLTQEFFFMTDDQATDFLLHTCNGRTRVLVQRTLSDEHYQLVYERCFQVPSTRQKELLRNLPARQEFADTVAERLGIPPEEVCVTLGRYKGFKDYRGLGIFNVAGKPITLPHYEPYWLAHAYVSAEHEHKQEAVAQILDELLLLR